MDDRGSSSVATSTPGQEEEIEDNFQTSKRWKPNELEDSQDQDQEREAEPLTIDDLFDELLQKILSYFPAQIVYGTFSKVCLRWERIAKDPCTLNQTQLILEDKDSELYLQVLKEAPCIGEVQIHPSYQPEALRALIQGPRVKKLHIVGDTEWHRDWPSPSDLIALLLHNKNSLQRLSMQVDSGLVRYHKTQMPGYPSFQSLIAGMGRLTHLHLAGECWRDWDEWDLATGHPQLRTLKIDSVSFVSDECPFIRDLIMLCKPTLRTLYLPCQLPQDAESLLNARVFEGSLVEELMVSTGCLRVVSQMPHLKILAVSDNGTEDNDLGWFKRTPLLSGVWKLTLQSVTETENEKEGFVWHMLSKFNNVEEFWGLESSMEEETFSMFLRNNPHIREMQFFDFCGFDNPNQVPLLESLPNLQVLDFALSQVSEEMSAALRSYNENRPTLKIVYGDEYDVLVAGRNE